MVSIRRLLVSIFVCSLANFSQQTYAAFPKPRGRCGETLTNTIQPATSVSELMAELLKKGSVDFHHPRYPDRTFRLHIQKDVISGGLFSANTDDNGLMMFVELLPNEAGKKPHLIALATGIKQSGPSDIDIEWVSRFNYSKLETQTKKVQANPRLAAPPPLINAIALNMIFGAKDETHAQLKLLHGYLTQVVWKGHNPTDQELMEYFHDKDANIQFEGVGQASIEYLSQAAPVGTKMSFDVAHLQTSAALDGGKPWDQTQLGRISSRNGWKLSSVLASNEDSLNRATLTKTENTQPFFSWK